MFNLHLHLPLGSTIVHSLLKLKILMTFNRQKIATILEPLIHVPYITTSIYMRTWVIICGFAFGTGLL
jgi:hypothetical protein